MLDFIKGEIVELTPTSVVIEAWNLGYMIAISLNTYSSLTKIKKCKLYLCEVFREDIHHFFGFVDKKERRLFLHLMSVSGVGANTARMILSALTVHELERIISSSDVLALKAIKGIGRKTAERIIIDLKDKVRPVDSLSGNAFVKNISSNTINKKEAISALVMLGFNQLTSQKVVDKVINNNPNFTIEQIIKDALKLL